MPTFTQHRKNMERKGKYILSNFSRDLPKFIYHLFGPISAFFYVMQCLFVNYKNHQAEKNGQITPVDYAAIKVPWVQIMHEVLLLWSIRPLHAVWKMISYPLIFGINIGLTAIRLILTFPLFWLSGKKNWIDYLLPHQWTTLFDRIVSTLIVPALGRKKKEQSECFLYKPGYHLLQDHLDYHIRKKSIIIEKFDHDYYNIIFFKEDGSTGILQLIPEMHGDLIDFLNRQNLAKKVYTCLENDRMNAQLRRIVVDKKGQTFSVPYDSSITKIIRQNRGPGARDEGSNKLQCRYKYDNKRVTTTRGLHTYSDGDQVYYFSVILSSQKRLQADKKKYLIVQTGNGQIVDDETTLESLERLAVTTRREVICVERRGVGFDYKPCGGRSFSQNRMGYYRGFDDLIRDGREFFDDLVHKKGAKPENISFIGTSLGGAEAVEITAENHRGGKKNNVVYISSFATFTDQVADMLYNGLRIEKGRDKTWVKVILFPFDILARSLLFICKYICILPAIWMIGLMREPVESYRSIPDINKLIMEVEGDRVVSEYGSTLSAEKSHHRAIYKAVANESQGSKSFQYAKEKDPSWFVTGRNCEPHCAPLEKLAMRDARRVSGLAYFRDWLAKPTALKDRMRHYLQPKSVRFNDESDGDAHRKIHSFR